MTEKILSLIALILTLDPQESGHFTKGKLPDSRILAEKLGEPVSAAERDEAFAGFTEEHPDEATALNEALNSPAEDEPAAEPAKTADESTMITGQDALKHLRSKGNKV